MSVDPKVLSRKEDDSLDTVVIIRNEIADDEQILRYFANGEQITKGRAIQKIGSTMEDLVSFSISHGNRYGYRIKRMSAKLPGRALVVERI